MVVVEGLPFGELRGQVDVTGIRRSHVVGSSALSRCRDITIHVVRYEDLVDDPKSVMAGVGEWLGVNPGAFPLEDVHGASVGKYRSSLSTEELKVVLDIAGAKLAQGQPLVNIEPGSILLPTARTSTPSSSTSPNSKPSSARPAVDRSTRSGRFSASVCRASPRPSVATTSVIAGTWPPKRREKRGRGPRLNAYPRESRRRSRLAK